MSSKYLLVISKDYWGTQTSEKLAKKFSEKFSNLIDIPNDHVTELIGSNVTLESVKNTICSFVGNVEFDHLYIYINGHGNQTFDINGDEPDGHDELYQLPDGNLIDDELTKIIDIAIFNNKKIQRSRPFLFLISDHCSSGSMLDTTQKYFDWVSIGSSLDNQDSFTSGDGNVMTNCLLNVLESQKHCLKDLTPPKLFELLDSEMKNSFIGDLQQCTLHMSNPSLSTFHLFD